jgi:predicted RNA binding protein YcfA (HicA-like mRNA interferase family)
MMSRFKPQGPYCGMVSPFDVPELKTQVCCAPVMISIMTCRLWLPDGWMLERVQGVHALYFAPAALGVVLVHPAQVNTVWHYSTGLYYITPNKEHTFCTCHAPTSDGRVIMLGGEAAGDAPYYSVRPHPVVISCQMQPSH